MVKTKNKDIMRVGDRIANSPKNVSTAKIRDFYNSMEFKEKQTINDKNYKKAEVNTKFWKAHKTCPSMDNIALTESLLLRSNFKILIIGSVNSHYQTAEVIMNTLKFKNTTLCVTLAEAYDKLRAESFDLILAESEVAGLSTHKISERTNNLIIMSGFNESQRKNLVNAGIKVFPVHGKGLKGIQTLALKVVLMMYSKSLT